MLATSYQEFTRLFSTIEDPREDEKILYPMTEILFLCIVGVLCCAESWREIVKFGNANLDFLRNYFPYEHGIPSKSLLSRIFGLLDKRQLEDFLVTFGNFICSGNEEKEKIIALDGKRVRGSKIHLLHAFATTSGIVLAQQDIENKKNESKAIPAFLERLCLKGAVVTADALNCQKPIAEKIISQDAEYFLSLKGNQGSLKEAAIELFKNKANMDYSETLDKGHGRIEIRKCWSTSDIGWVHELNPGWTNLQSICCIERERHIKDKVTKETVYYISSTKASSEKHLFYSREHWGIENKAHWVLDYIFNEDRSTLCSKNAAQNMAVVRKIVINMIKRYKEATGDKTAIKTLRKAAVWNKEEGKAILKYLAAN